MRRRTSSSVREGRSTRGGAAPAAACPALLAVGVLPRVHGQASNDTAAHTVDGRRQAAGRGRYCAPRSADYRTRRQSVRVGAEGQVPVVLPPPPPHPAT